MNSHRSLVWIWILLACMSPLIPGCGRGGRPQASSDGVVEIQIGADVPSFMPWHLTGPHAGKAACPLCVYGARPSAAIWTGLGGLPQAVRIAVELDRAIDAQAPDSAVGYVVLLPEGSTPRVDAEQALRAAFASTPLSHVFLTIADRAGNDEDVQKYRPSRAPGAATTTLVYQDRTLASIHQNLGTSGAPLAALRPALERLLPAQAPSQGLAVWMCSADEPGEPLEFFGRVLDENGNPLPKASVIAYNADIHGLYVPTGSTSRTPRINAVAVTDAGGWYRFHTIRPGGYPNSGDPQHIHLHIDAAVHQHTYRTLWFEDDPRLTPDKRRALDQETVIVPLTKRDDGAWVTQLDIELEGS